MSRRLKHADTSKRVSYPLAIAELIARDPLFTELCTAVREASTTGKDELRADKIAALQQNLSNKYCGIVHVQVPDPPLESRITFASPELTKSRAMSYTLSTIAFAAGSWGPEKAQRVSNCFFPHPGHDPAPAIYLRVDLSRTTLWDLDILAADFKEVIRKALTISRGTGALSDPKELAFLNTVRQDVFYRDLRRYDLHTKYHLSYRLIGFLEKHGCSSLPDISLSSHQVGKPISTESSVSDSVRRIYAAIHRATYRRKSIQPEQGPNSERQYHCSDHGRECPASCPQLKQFASWFDRNFRRVSLITRPYTSKNKARKSSVQTSLK